MRFFFSILIATATFCFGTHEGVYQTLLDTVRPFDYIMPSSVTDHDISRHAKKFAMFSIMISIEHAQKNSCQKDTILTRLKTDLDGSFVYTIAESYFKEAAKGKPSNKKRKYGKENDQNLSEIPQYDVDPQNEFIGSCDSLTSLGELHQDFNIQYLASQMYIYIHTQEAPSSDIENSMRAPSFAAIKDTPFIGIKFFENNVNHPRWMESIYIREALLENWRRKVICLQNHLKYHLSGQDNAIDTFVDGIFNHYAKRIKRNFVNHLVEMGYQDIAKKLEEQKSASTILLLGPSGTGKTEMVQLTCQFLKLPIGRGSGANLSPAGYKGDDPSDSVIQLIEDAKKFTKSHLAKAYAADQGIIFLDEIDKLAVATYEDRFREGSQNALLTFIEGSQPICFGLEDYFNTQNILFIMAGAFSGLIPPRATPTIKPIMHADLIQYGLRPELVNRIYRIVQTNPLTKDDLLNIMVHPKNSPLYRLLREYKEFHKLSLSIAPQALDYFAQEIEKQSIGARNIYSFLEKTFGYILKAHKNNQSMMQSILALDENAINAIGTENQMEKIKKILSVRSEKIKTASPFLDVFGSHFKKEIMNKESILIPKCEESCVLDPISFRKIIQEDILFLKKELVPLRYYQRRLNITLDHVKAYFKTLKETDDENMLLMYGIM